MNIIIADDDALVSISLKTILESDDEIKVLGIGRDGHEAVELFFRYNPDIVLLDIQMPVMTGLEAAKQILTGNPKARILFLTTFSDNDYIIEALSMGSKGYILKQEFESIIPALNAIMNGQTVFGKEIGLILPNLLHGGKAFSYRDFGISEKEEEIIVMVAQGLSNKEIAEKAYLGAGTVRNYLSGILDKLELRDRTQLAIFHYRNHG